MSRCETTGGDSQAGALHFRSKVAPAVRGAAYRHDMGIELNQKAIDALGAEIARATEVAFNRVWSLQPGSLSNRP